VTLSQGHEFKLKYSTCLCKLVLDGHDPCNVSIKHRGILHNIFMAVFAVDLVSSLNLCIGLAESFLLVVSVN